MACVYDSCSVLRHRASNNNQDAKHAKLTIQFVEHHDLVLGVLVREQDGHVRAAMVRWKGGE